MVAGLIAKLSIARRRRANSLRERGDQARSDGRWQEAADHYDAFLELVPSDFDIRVQLGHMHKEAGALVDAERAYVQALRLRKDDADLLLNLGHLFKLTGKVEQAAAYYFASTRSDPAGHALAELQGSWLSSDIRSRYLDEMGEPDKESQKRLRKVTSGAKITAVRGMNVGKAESTFNFGYDPRVELEFTQSVKMAAVAVIEIEYERIEGFDCAEGILFIDLGNGFENRLRLEVVYPAGQSGRLVLFLAAPAAIRAVRWDPTERPGGGIRINAIKVEGVGNVEALIARINQSDVIWTHEGNRIAPDELRNGIGPFFFRSKPLAAAEHKVMQSYLPTAGDRGHDYTHWRYRYANPGVEEYHRMSVMIDEMAWHPKFSFVMPVYNTDPDLLREVMDAMIGQNYPNFEICVIDDCSSKSDVAKILAEYSEKFPNLRWKSRVLNGHISAASNSALNLATGDFVVLVDHDDLIPPYALFVVASYLNRFSDAKVLFSDEDKINPQGDFFDPYFKTAYNQFLMFGHNMISHLGVYERQLLEDIGGFRIGLEGSQDYDLFLRASESVRPSQIVHIPHVLYHWRQVPGSTAIGADQKNYAEIAARVSINNHLGRTGLPLQSVAGHAPGNSAIVVQREFDIPVSIIIPTRNGIDLLRPCLDSIMSGFAEGVEIIIADNDSDDPEALDFLRQAPALYKDVNLKVVRVPGPFNFSQINNVAAEAASGEILCFLNNDTEVIAPDWINRARGLLSMSDVGAVGAKLLYPDGSIQHFGLVTGMYGHGVAGGIHLFQPANAYGYFSKPCMIQEFTAVTAACMFVRKSLFWEVGGFETELAVAYNDVDLCLKLRRQGKRILCDPRILLTHKESKSRGSDATAERMVRLDREASWMKEKWSGVLDMDPFFSPNHSLDRPDFALAYPPRQKWPWEYDDADSKQHSSGRIARAPCYFAEGAPAISGTLAVCAIMKDEATNIVEWLAYHHAIGVEKFFLYDNGSSDNVSDLLAPLVNRGLVEIIPWPINPGQREAYDDFSERQGANWTWAAFIDIDEFINPFGFESLPEWLAGFEDASAIAIQWRNFGPNGHDKPTAGLMIEAYTTRLEDQNPVHQHVKSFVRMKDFSKTRSPHSFWVSGRVVDEHGGEIDQQGDDYAIMPIREHVGICVNHYYTRSRAEWYAKIARGMADSAKGAPNRRDPAWLEGYERDAIWHDDSIVRFAPAVRATLAAWGYPEGPSLGSHQ